MVLRDFFTLTGIRKKLFIYYFIVVLAMGLTSFYSYYNAKLALEKTDTLFMDYVSLNELYVNINSLETELERYLATQSSDDLLNYYTANNKLLEMLEDEPELSYDVNDLMLRDIYHMTAELLEETDAAVYAKRGRNTAQYIEHFENSKRISGYIKLYINDLLYNKLNEGSVKYEQIADKMNFVLLANIIIILSASLLSMLLALVITYQITKPLVKLANAAERIAQEDFDIEPLETNSKDEISILSKAFNQMVVSIRNYIDKMLKQKEIEDRLREQEVQNLKMKSLLKDAELKALQSQINPHFLFNTLNYATQLAMLEGADQSSEFIHKAAELFRYSLKGLDSPVTLQSEIENVQAYVYVLKSRFKDRFEFYLNIDDGLKLEVPGLILQPIVENAFIHGLENVTKGGRILLNVKAETERVIIEITDNGQGMPRGKIAEVLGNGGGYDEAHEHHLTGLGLTNVIERIKLFYNLEYNTDVIEIYSVEGEGTTIVLKIPKRGCCRYVQTSGS